MATENITRSVTFGPLYAGKSSSLTYLIRDKTDTIRIGPTTGGSNVSEMTGTGSYKIKNLPVDPSWVPCSEEYSITGQAGVGVQGTFGLEAFSLAANASAILDDVSDLSTATPGSLRWLCAVNLGLINTGTVADTNPGTKSFIITLDAGQVLPSDKIFRGLTLCFINTATLAPAKQVVDTYDLIDSTHAKVSFLAPFAGLPANGDPFQLL